MASQEEYTTIGARVRICRRYRGMTLETLAGLAGLSTSYLSMVENGRRQLDRRSYIEAIASALQVSVTDLTGQPYSPTDTAQAAAQAAVPALRLALFDGNLDDVHATPDLPPLPELLKTVRKVEELCADSDFARYGALLPSLLENLHSYGSHPDTLTRRAGLAGLLRVLHAAFYLSKDLGHHDLALLIAERCADAARRLEDPAWLAISEFLRAHAMMPAGARGRSRHIVQRAADSLQPHLTTVSALPVYGMLHLTSALNSAALREPEQAAAHLAEAAEIAEITGETADFQLHFGPTNVALWNLAIAVELREGGRAPTIAERVDPRVLRSRGRQAAFYADLGRGLAQIRGKDPDALAMLRRAEELAPQQIRTNPHVRETVAVMLQRARATAGGRDLRGLAHRMGVA
jgi:transcriptional regulator with XRE-family HTH domain